MLLIEKIIRDPSSHRTLLHSDLVIQSGIRFYSEQFFLLLVDVVDYLPQNSAPVPLAHPGVSLDRALLTTVITALGENFLCYPFISNSDYFLLVNLKEPYDSGNSAQQVPLPRLVSLCHSAVSGCLQHYGLKVRIFISQWIPSLDDLDKHFSYFRLSISRGNAPGFYQDVVTADEATQAMNHESQSMRSRIYACERKIATCAMAKDFTGLSSAFSKLIDLESTSYPRTLSMNDRAASRIECLFGLMDIPYFTDRYPFIRADTCLEMIRDALTADDLKETIQSILADFRTFCMPAARPIEIRIEEIADYIQTNYTDPELSGDLLATKFGISISYLSTVFKEKTGGKLLDYIHQCRLKQAQELLLNTDQTIETIAANVGYHNALTLTRAFKRYLNVTPGRFRADHLMGTF
jgi:AraC-like DNA-binding protein